MNKLCPSCHCVYLRERSDIESHRGWLSCSVCRYMTKVVKKEELTNNEKDSIISKKKETKE